MGINTSLSEKISANRYLPYLVAMGCALSASLICGLFRNFVSSGGCHVLLFLVVTVCAWYCGVGPAITAIVISLLGSTFGFIPNLHSFAMPGATQFSGSLVFLVSSVLVIVMGETRRHQNEALLEAQTELEERVRERTSDLDAVNRSLRELSARLMQLQDDERRRIARELHDSVGQTLAALAMNLSLVRGDLERLSTITVALNDSENLVRDMSKEVRTISHLLHPPLLDEAGLASALRWYVDGFVQRSRIQVDLDLPEDFPRLPSEVETAVFRVVQECLTNIHRHSGSAVAKIHVRQRHEQVLVDIEDQGRGIPLEKREELATSGTPGVGIRGMRERLRQLGGTLEINSNSGGTVVTVQLPLEERSGTDAESIVDPAAA